MTRQINGNAIRLGAFPAMHRRATTGMAALALALGASAISTAVAASDDGRGNGPSIPSLLGQAKGIPGGPIRAATGLPAIPSVIPASVNVPAVPVVVVPAAPVVNVALPTVAAIAVPAAAVSVPARPAALPAAGALNEQAVTIPGTPGHDGGSPVFTTGRGEVMLAAGQSVELVDPSTPGLRVQVAAPVDKAMAIGAIINESRNSGIFAGLSGRQGGKGAHSAIAMPDGRILLASARSANSGKSAGRAGNSNVEASNGNGAAGLLRDNSGSGKALANGNVVDVSPGESGISDGAKGQAKATSQAERAVTSQDRADERETVENSARVVGGRKPRTCS